MTNNNAVAAVEPITSEMLEQVLVDGNLDKLSPEDRLTYYRRVCDSLGLNPLTKPFQYIKLSGRLTLYATKDATDQIRKLQRVSIVDMQADQIGDLYRVQVKATDSSGRSEISSGVVNVKGLQGENLANAMMKAETKAKRRVTLSLCGLGILDESEVDSIPSHAIQHVDRETGELPPRPRQVAAPAASADGPDIKTATEFWPQAIRLGFRDANDVHEATGINPTAGNVNWSDLYQMLLDIKDEEA